MIQVLLLILKIIGITIAVLLLLVLLVLALVLFAPIRYRARVVHTPKKDEISGRASFLFPLVVFKFRYFEKVFSYKGRAFWYVFAESGKNKEEKAAKKDKKDKNNRKPDLKKEQGATEREAASQDVTTDDTEDLRSEETQEILEKITPLVDKKSKRNGKKEKEKKEKPQGEKVSFLDKIKRLFRQKDEVLRILKKTENKATILFVWDKLKKTLRHILPGKVKGYLIYGNSDPAVTGQVLGGIAMLYAATGPVLKIVPDFERERLECDLEFKGRLRIFTLLVILLKIYFNKELKKLIQEFKAIKEIE